MSIIFGFMRRHIADKTAYSVTKFSTVGLSTVQRWKKADNDSNETLDSVESILQSQGFEIVDQGEKLLIQRRKK